MKNIIYLSLVIILLTSCKGSSFLKQRYTHLGHSVVKNTAPKKSNTKQEVAKNNSIAPTEKSNEQSVVITQQKSTEIPVKVENETKIVNAAPAPVFKNKKLQAIYERANVLKLDTKKEIGFNSKKLNSEDKKVSAAMGVINKVLKIILLILVLAIVVALIVLVSTVNA